MDWITQYLGKNAAKTMNIRNALRVTLGVPVPIPHLQKAAESLVEVIAAFTLSLCKSLANSRHWLINLLWPSTSSLSTCPKGESLKKDPRDCQGWFLLPCHVSKPSNIHQLLQPARGMGGTVKDPLLTAPSSSLLFHFELVSLPFTSFVIAQINLFSLLFFLFDSFPGGLWGFVGVRKTDFKILNQQTAALSDAI